MNAITHKDHNRAMHSAINQLLTTRELCRTQDEETLEVLKHARAVISQPRVEEPRLSKPLIGLLALSAALAIANLISLICRL
ncbi:MAG: hypothetical protein WCO60_20080 [Verrucomicrobiota bacterium]